MYEKYEWLSLYILMIKKWDSMQEFKNSYKNLTTQKWDSMSDQATNTNDCKWIIRYFEEIFVIQHTDQNRTK